MMTLAQEIVSILPMMLKRDKYGVPLKKIAAELVADMQSIRQAANEAERSGEFKLLRRGRTIFAVAANYRGHICVVCRAAYLRPRKSRRTTCSRSCAVSLSWNFPNTKARRIAGIRAERQTPAAKKRLEEHNRRRWSKPTERQKLSDWNRRRWSDPVMKAKLSIAIAEHHRKPEYRAEKSVRIKARWDSPEGRKKMVDGIRKSKSTSKYRLAMAEEMKRRWNDPKTRPKYLAAVKRNAAIAAAKVKGKKQSEEHKARRLKSEKIERPEKC